METTWTLMNKISRLLGIWWKKTPWVHNFIYIHKLYVCWMYMYICKWNVIVYFWVSIFVENQNWLLGWCTKNVGLNCFMKILKFLFPWMWTWKAKLNKHNISWFSNQIMLVSSRSKEGITFIMAWGIFNPWNQDKSFTLIYEMVHDLRCLRLHKNLLNHIM